MQHILLISAYTNLDFLLEQLKLYDNAIDFKIYIHWDKKMFSPNILQALSSHKSVKKVLSIYTIYWGGHNLLMELRLLVSTNKCPIRMLTPMSSKDNKWGYKAGCKPM